MRPAQTNIRREDGMGGECRNLAAHHHHWVHLTAYSNAYAERFVLTIKSECLNHIVPLGERHLRLAVSQFVEHYHLDRNHQGLGNRLITTRAQPVNENAPIECRERLGGLLKHYDRAA